MPPRNQRIVAHTDLRPIPPDELWREVNKPVHVRWAWQGCVWILRKIDGETVTLETPKTRQTRTARAADLYYTRYRAECAEKRTQRA